jgi:hypothetical protein
MLWFKHHNNFRNNPSMKVIKKHLGDAGIAGAYRLLEVICERCGTGEEFNPVLTLGGATDKRWLGEEVLLPTNAEEFGGVGFITQKEIDDFLSTCAFAGLIERGSWSGPGRTWDDTKQGWVDGTVTLETITVPGLYNMADETTRKYRAYAKKNFRGLGTPK